MNQELLSSVLEGEPYPLLFVTISGAHLYGFPSADSDYDVRGVHVLPLRRVIGLEVSQETIERTSVLNDPADSSRPTSDTGVARYSAGLDSTSVTGGRRYEIDLVTHDVRKFMRMLLKSNGYVLEQLYSQLIVRTTPEHAELNDIARGCITRQHAHHYLGFTRTQWGLFEKDRRAKPLLYVYRVLLTGIHLMRTGAIEADLRRLNEVFRLPYIDELIAAKTAGAERGLLPEADVEFHARECQRLTAELETARDASTLPDVPTARAALNELLVRLRQKYSRLDARESESQSRTSSSP